MSNDSAILPAGVIGSVALMILIGCGKPPATPPLTEAKTPAAPALELSIPLPMNSAGLRYLHTGAPEGVHLPLLLTNKSNRPIRVWMENNSWGHKGLSCEVTSNHGATQILSQRGLIVWNHNAPMFHVLQPQEQVAFDMDPGDTKKWEGPTLTHGSTYEFRAIYEINPTPASKKLDVWTGRIMSETKECMLIGGSSTVDARKGGSSRLSLINGPASSPPIRRWAAMTAVGLGMIAPPSSR